jgi:glycosyltransferase involved in cell wall biosynthesis
MTKKIKIAFLNDTMGPYHYARLEASNISSDCTFIEFSNEDHTNYWDTSKEKVPNKITLFDDKPITQKSKKEIKKRLFSVLNNITPDVVLISGWDAIASLLGVSWSIANNIPIIILSESQSHDFKRLKIKEFAKRYLLKLFDSAFVGGINQMQYLEDLGFNKEKIFPGCDLVDNEYFIKNSKLSKESKSLLRKNLNLPEKFLFTSCRFIEKKNLKFLLEVFKQFNDIDSSWNLVIAGDGPLKDELTEMASNLNIDDKVFYPGYIQYNQIPIFYGLSSCFVLPSTTEQWGLVVNESLSCSKPVLVSKMCGSAPNLVEGRDVGFTFDPYNKDDLLDKLKRITVKENLIKFSENAPKVMEEFDKYHYSSNLNKAAEAAIKFHNKKTNFLSITILNLLIAYSK